MKHIKGFAIILAVSFAGEALGYIIPLPVPASIYGMIIMLALLFSGLLPVGAVKSAGDLLIEIMPMLFIPAAVGLIVSWGELRPVIVQYAVIIVLSTVAVMAVSGLVTQAVIRGGRKRRE